jgi:hypothetical protein
VKVEGTQSWDGEQFRAENLAEGGDEEDVRVGLTKLFENLRLIDFGRLQNGHGKFFRQLFHHIDVLMMSTTCFVGLSNHERNGVGGFKYGRKAGSAKSPVPISNTLSDILGIPEQ